MMDLDEEHAATIRHITKKIVFGHFPTVEELILIGRGVSDMSAEIKRLREEIAIRKDAHNKLTIINWDLRTKSDMMTKRVKKAEIESKRLRKALPNEDELQCLRACVNSASKRSSGAGYPNPSDIASNVLDRIDAVIKNGETR